VSGYVLRGGREGYERLRLLARARRADTLALFDLAAVQPGWRCLDVGCGGGEVAFEVARLVGPSGYVTGLDMNEVSLDLARGAAADRGVGNAEFRVADVNEWREPAAYDLVYCRFLLHHLRRPVDLLARMWEAVRPGGVLVVEDADFDGLFCDPPNDGFAFYAGLYPRVLARRGGDHTAGRKLRRHALEAGVPEPRLRLAQGVQSAGDTKYLPLTTLEGIADAAVAEGLATAAEIEAAATSLRAFIEEPRTTIGDPRTFQLWAPRPLSA